MGKFFAVNVALHVPVRLPSSRIRTGKPDEIQGVSTPLSKPPLTISCVIVGVLAGDVVEEPRADVVEVSIVVSKEVDDDVVGEALDVVVLGVEDVVDVTVVLKEEVVDAGELVVVLEVCVDAELVISDVDVVADAVVVELVDDAVVIELSDVDEAVLVVEADVSVVVEDSDDLLVTISDSVVVDSAAAEVVVATILFTYPTEFMIGRPELITFVAELDGLS